MVFRLHFKSTCKPRREREGMRRCQQVPQWLAVPRHSWHRPPLHTRLPEPSPPHHRSAPPLTSMYLSALVQFLSLLSMYLMENHSPGCVGTQRVRF